MEAYIQIIHCTRRGISYRRVQNLCIVQQRCSSIAVLDIHFSICAANALRLSILSLTLIFSR